MHSHVGIDLHDIVNLIAVSHVFLLKLLFHPKNFSVRIIMHILQ